MYYTDTCDLPVDHDPDSYFADPLEEKEFKHFDIPTETMKPDKLVPQSSGFEFPTKLEFQGYSYNLQNATKPCHETDTRTAYYRCCQCRPTQKRLGCTGRAMVLYNIKTGSTETTQSKPHDNCKPTQKEIQVSDKIVDVSEEHREIIDSLALTKPTPSAITLSKEAHSIIQEKYSGYYIYIFYNLHFCLF